MFMFIDGRPLVLSFEQVEMFYYKAFVQRFPGAQVSLTQWRGSYEYQAVYPDIQMSIETGVITLDSLNQVLDSIAEANETIKRPAVLASRVTERFKEAGYEATVRIADATTKGVMAICVDQKGGDDAIIGNLIRDELLPAGQHMEGSVDYETAISNGQPLTVRWSIPTDTTLTHRVTITRGRGSQHPQDPVDEIVAKFNANFDSIMGIGLDLTPARYLTTVDLPWASSVLVEWDNAGAWTTAVKVATYTDRFLADLPHANVVIL